MPLWALLLVVTLVLVACPLTMWVMGRLTGRKVQCGMWGLGGTSHGQHNVTSLEARKAEVEREIARLEGELHREGLEKVDQRE